MDQFCEVKDCKGKGKGLFAKKPLGRGRTVEVDCPSTELPMFSKFQRRHQITNLLFKNGDSYFYPNILPDGTYKQIVFYANHSDTPNATFDGMEFQVIQNIKKGGEILFDYGKDYIEDAYYDGEDWAKQYLHPEKVVDVCPEL